MLHRPRRTECIAFRQAAAEAEMRVSKSLKTWQQKCPASKIAKGWGNRVVVLGAAANTPGLQGGSLLSDTQYSVSPRSCRIGIAEIVQVNKY